MPQGRGLIKGVKYEWNLKMFAFPPQMWTLEDGFFYGGGAI